MNMPWTISQSVAEALSEVGSGVGPNGYVWRSEPAAIVRAGMRSRYVESGPFPTVMVRCSESQSQVSMLGSAVSGFQAPQQRVALRLYVLGLFKGTDADIEERCWNFVADVKTRLGVAPQIDMLASHGGWLFYEGADVSAVDEERCIAAAEITYAGSYAWVPASI